VPRKAPKIKCIIIIIIIRVRVRVRFRVRVRVRVRFRVRARLRVRVRVRTYRLLLTDLCEAVQLLLPHCLGLLILLHLQLHLHLHLQDEGCSTQRHGDTTRVEGLYLCVISLKQQH